MTKKPSIEALAAKFERLQAKRKALVDSASKLEAKLNAVFAGTGVFGRGVDLTLERLDPSEFVYGHLSYSSLGRLWVNYRETNEDEHDDHYGVPDDERTYAIKTLEDCAPQWVERLLAEDHVSSMLMNIDARIDEMEGRADQSLAVLEKIVAAESTSIDEQMGESLQAFGNETLKSNWGATLDALHLNPAHGLASASSYVESVCAGILHARGVALPDNKSMGPLLKATLKALDWPEDKLLPSDVARVTTGVATLSEGIGALRTHFSTAHGAASHQPPLAPEFATLAKNAGAAVAIFLIDRHKNGGTPTPPGAHE